MRHLFSTSAVGLLLFTLSACQSIDCPLDSVVVWTLTFFDSETDEALSLPYTLTVDAEGAGTLYNKGKNIKSMELPMSVAATTDTLYLTFTLENDEGETEETVTDTLFIDHTNTPHFEAIDCPGAVFHTITATRNTTHDFFDLPLVIDSVRIIRPLVDFNDVENIRLYLRTSQPAAASEHRESN